VIDLYWKEGKEGGNGPEGGGGPVWGVGGGSRGNSRHSP